MDSQIKLLISLIKEEQASLQSMIDEYLLESEYLMAHYHLQALYRAGRKLQTLNNINDKLFDKKTQVQRRIELYQKEHDATDSDSMRQYYALKLSCEHLHLETLDASGEQPSPGENLNLLNEIISKLLEKQIKNVKLVLNKAENFQLNFSYSRKILKISITGLKRLIKRGIIRQEQLASLQVLGFELLKNNSRLAIHIPGTKDQIIEKLQITMAKMVFEIFYFQQFAKQSYIHFTEKTKIAKNSN